MTEKEKQLFEKGELLPLVEEFYTLQGEGYHTGKAAYFVRLGGCDVGCEWCDTKFTWNPDFQKLTPSIDIVEKAAKFPAKAVVVTGGEPTCYKLGFLTSELSKRGVATFIETAGTNPLTGTWDWVCLSPKRHSPPLTGYFDIANELKVIVQENQDFEWAEKTAARVKNNCKLFLQPEWGRYNAMISIIVEYIKNNPKWEISLQAHKFMRIP